MIMQPNEKIKLRIEALEQAVKIMINPINTNYQGTVSNTMNYGWSSPTPARAVDVLEMAEQFYEFLSK
jgi:hypothetical protein